MSRFVAGLVYRKRVGSMARKSILAYCAERANDDGGGVWASKVRIAKEVECSKQTVIDTIKALVRDGLMIEVGKRKIGNGYVVEYALDICAIMALQDAIEDQFSTSDLRGPDLDTSNDLTPRGQAAGPQEVKPLDPNRPLTVLKPSNTPKPPEGDLFGDPEQDHSQPDPEVEAIESGFEEFWNDIWPSHVRKKAKADCRTVYFQACTGKHRKAEKVSPTTLNRCAKAYIASVRDPQYLKGTLPWLREPGWEPFLEAQAEESPAISRYRRIIEEHKGLNGGAIQ